MDGEATGCFRVVADGILLDLAIQPRASRSAVVGIHDGALKLRLTAPPVEGAANKECVRLLSKTFGIAKTRIRLVKGERSRRKRVLLKGLSHAEVEEVVNKFM